MSVPAGYCETGTHLRMAEADARQFMEEERRLATAWHQRAKVAHGNVLAHREACADCASKPVQTAVAS